MRNHLGSYECKLCLTLHNNEGSYLAHTQGKKHQANLARRAAKEKSEEPGSSASMPRPNVDIKKFVKIGNNNQKRFSLFGDHVLNCDITISNRKTRL